MGIENFSKKKNKHNTSSFSSNSVKTKNRAGLNEYKIKSFEDVKYKWIELCSYFRAYPDKFLLFISDTDSKIRLYFYQVIYLRIMMRYRKVFLTATRGTAKSYLQNLCFILKCIMYPKTKLFTCAVGKEQAAKIAADCIDDILEHYPLLSKEIRRYTKSKDYTKLVFHNGSKYDVVQMRDSTRGGRRTGGGIEEVADKKFDGDMLNAVVIPLMANNRLANNGRVDPNEVHKSEFYITTAGSQQTFAYRKMKEVSQDMLDGKSAFTIGNSYELPCLYGQLDIDFVEEVRESPTYSPLDFMREYCSVWTGSSSDNLVSDEKLQKARKVIYAEWENCNDGKAEYVLAYDVARSEGQQNALSALVIIKIYPKADGTYTKEIVNIFSREGEHDTLQAKFLKHQMALFKGKMLVIDANGLGSGVVDQLVLDLQDGEPPYSVMGASAGDYNKYKLQNSLPVLYALKAQNKETKDSDMINYFMKIFQNEKIGLLKSSSEAVDLLAKKMKVDRNDLNRMADLEVPYLLTNALCDEIMNLEYKAEDMKATAKQLSSGIPKDKYSALKYGLYWLYLEELKNIEKLHKNNIKTGFKNMKYRAPKKYGNRR